MPVRINIGIIICFLSAWPGAPVPLAAAKGVALMGLQETVAPDTVADGLKLGRDVRYREEKADAYLVLGEMSRRERQNARALHNYFSAIYELEILGDSLRIADTKSKIGGIFQEDGLYDKALEYYNSGLLIYLKKGIVNDHSELLQRIGEVHYEKREFDKALKNFIRAGEFYLEKGSDSSYIQTCFQEIQCYNAMDQFDKSLELNFTILDYYRKEGNKAKEVISLNNTGVTYKNLGNHTEALNYFRKAGSLESELQGSEGPVTLVNQAIVYQNMGDDREALRKLNEASRSVEKLSIQEQAPEFYHLTALVYYNLADYHNAIIYNNTSIDLAMKNGQADVLERAYLLSSMIYEKLYDYEESMSRYQDHLTIKDSLRRERIMARQKISDAQLRAEETTRETERLWASGELSYLELQRLKLDSANRQQELEILYKADSIQRITIQNQLLENQRARQALLLKEEQVYAARKAKEVDSLRQIEKIQTLELEKQLLTQKQQEEQIERIAGEKKIATLELKKVQTRNKWLAVFGALSVIIIYLVYRGLRYAKRTNKILVKQKNEIERQKDEIEYERNRSDKLLLNILPEETAEELKEKGAATPKHYEMVSVLFTDFKGFTNIAEKLTPRELVAELDNCFLEFDRIIDKHNLEKIKTIGDAYMCAGGIPIANQTNPLEIVEAGLEIKAFMEKLKADREAKGEEFWELRIGIHTGPVIAGVVGKNKFAYDIWGDAVNTASRMESSGIPGKVNISGETYRLVKDMFICTYRGKVQAKNKGEIDMYIVEGKK